MAGLLEPTLGGIILDGRGDGGARAQASHGVPRTTRCCPGSASSRNVALAVGQVESDKRAVAERVDYYLSLVQMDHASQKMPHELSGA